MFRSFAFFALLSVFSVFSGSSDSLSWTDQDTVDPVGIVLLDWGDLDQRLDVDQDTVDLVVMCSSSALVLASEHDAQAERATDPSRLSFAWTEPSVLSILYPLT